MADENEQAATERDFVKSWDLVEQFYNYSLRIPDDKNWQALLDLIGVLRKRGCDKQLRAGAGLQMGTFILSRSRRDGLRAGQASLRFETERNGGMNVRYREKSELKTELTLERIELTPEVEGLLRQLLAQPID